MNHYRKILTPMFRAAPVMKYEGIPVSFEKLLQNGFF
jgi:hypothetical protein